MCALGAGGRDRRWAGVRLTPWAQHFGSCGHGPDFTPRQNGTVLGHGTGCHGNSVCNVPLLGRLDRSGNRGAVRSPAVLSGPLNARGWVLLLGARARE